MIDLSTIDPEETSYGYIPSRGVSYAFVCLFAVATCLHLGQTIRFRMWWTLPTIILAGCLEILGWSGRLWSSYNPMHKDPFMIQIVCTIIGPTPLLAANFMMFGAIIRILGPMYSRLGPRKYSLFFVSCDIVSLVVQGAGGGIAASADDGDVNGADLGGNIMLGGIALQLVIISIYFCLTCEFFWRYTRNRPVGSKSRGYRVGSTATLTETDYRGDLSRSTKLMIGALGLNLLCLFIRAIYRTIELTDGWNGEIITTEIYFVILDGAMIVLAMVIFNVAHPGLLIGRDMGKNEELKKSNSSVQLVGFQA